MPYFILKDLKNAGVTLHKLSKDFDAGDILIQDSFPVLPVENIESLSCKMQMLAQRLLMQFMENIDFYWDNASPQIGGEYWPVPSDDERTLNWDLSHIEIDRVVRAFGKCESYAIFDNKKWFVRGVTTWAESHNSTPGTIVHRTNKEVVLACSDGYVCIRFYQPIDTDLDNNN